MFALVAVSCISLAFVFGDSGDASTPPANYDLAWSDPTIRTNWFSGGTGTAGNPWQISTPNELGYLSHMVNSGTTYSGQFFVLTADIDLTGHIWVAIGGQGRAFMGSFLGSGLDGQQHHVIRVSPVVRNGGTDGRHFGGLFGVAHRATIGNFSLVGEVHTWQNSSATIQQVGGVIGHANQVRMYNIANFVDIDLRGMSTNNSSALIGGIVGGAHSESVHVAKNNLVNHGNILVNNVHSVGGIAGYLYNSNPTFSAQRIMIIYNSYNLGNISADSINGVGGVGGIAGSIYSQGESGNHNAHGNYEFINTYNAGELLIAGASSVARMDQTVGSWHSNHNNFHNVMLFSNFGVRSDMRNLSVNGGTGTWSRVDVRRQFIGQFDPQTGDITTMNVGTKRGDSLHENLRVGINLFTTDFNNPQFQWTLQLLDPGGTRYFSTFPFVARGLGVQWQIDPPIPCIERNWLEVGIRATSFAGGTGTQADPFQISTPAELGFLSSSVSSGNRFTNQFVVLTDDIDLTRHTWIPIGNNDRPFSGHFSGAGLSGEEHHTITLPSRVHVPSSISGGLFAHVNWAGGSARAAWLANFSLLGNVEEWRTEGRSIAHFGAVVGHANGVHMVNIANFVDLDLSGFLTNSTGSHIGGIAGSVHSPHSWWEKLNIANHGNIRAGAVHDIGGVFGLAYNTNPTFSQANAMVIANCYNIGDVSATQINAVGGIGGIVGRLFSQGQSGNGNAQATYRIINTYNMGELLVNGVTTARMDQTVGIFHSNHNNWHIVHLRHNFGIRGDLVNMGINGGTGTSSRISVQRHAIGQFNPETGQIITPMRTNPQLGDTLLENLQGGIATVVPSIHAGHRHFDFDWKLSSYVCPHTGKVTLIPTFGFVSDFLDGPSFLATPTNVTVMPTLTGRGNVIRWEWDENRPEAQAARQVFRIFANDVQIGQTASMMMFTHNATTPGIYSYTVQAIARTTQDEMVDSRRSIAVSSTLLRKQLGVPFGLRTQMIEGKHYLIWNGVTGGIGEPISGYSVYRSLNNAPPVQLAMVNAPTTMLEINLSDNADYKFHVVALAGTNAWHTNSENSEILNIIIDIQPEELNRPTNLSGRVNASGVISNFCPGLGGFVDFDDLWMTWTGDSNASGYFVYINEFLDEEPRRSTGRLQLNDFNFSDLPEGPWYIRVRAAGNGVTYSDSELSTEYLHVYIYPPGALPHPENIRVTNQTITWDFVPNATGYRVIITNSTTSTTTTHDVTTTSFTKPTPWTVDHIYRIQVIAIGDGMIHFDSPASPQITHMITSGPPVTSTGRLVLRADTTLNFMDQNGDIVTNEMRENDPDFADIELFLGPLAAGESLVTVIAQFTNDKIYVKVFARDGTTEITDLGSVVATGQIIRLYENGTGIYIDSVTIVVRGDVRGYGNINFSDVNELLRHVRVLTTLEGAFLLAADIRGYNNINFSDVNELLRHVRGLSDIHEGLRLVNGGGS